MPKKKNPAYLCVKVIEPNPETGANFIMLPPKRPNHLPICGERTLPLTSRMRDSFGGKYYESWRGPRKGGKPASSAESEEWPISSTSIPNDDGQGGIEPPTSLLVPSRLFSFTGASGNFNFALAGNPRTTDYVRKDGLRVTEIRGFEDEKEIGEIEPIAMMSMKKCKEKKHPKYSLKTNNMYLVRLHQIVDPSNFFMEFVTDPPSDGFATWDESLQEFYSDPEIVRKYKMKTIRPVLGQQYAIYDNNRKKWERVRVHSFNYRHQVVTAMYMDRLIIDGTIPVNKLVELHPQFGNWHRYPINGGLRDVVPPQDPNTDWDVNQAKRDPWPEDSIDYFKQSTEGKLLRAFVVSNEWDMSDNIFHSFKETRFAKLTVLLFEVGAEHEVPINAWMVMKGLATPIKSMLDCARTAELFHGIKLNESPSNANAEIQDETW